MVRLELEQLSFQYKKQPVFDGIDLAVSGGELLSLVGPNGTGKTTLLKCINHLLKPASGAVLVNGIDTRSLSPKELAQKIAYVPQSDHVRFPISALDAVMLGRRPHMKWRASASDLDAVFQVFCQMGIEHLAHKQLDQMSGGERQKVMLAKAIVQEPQILLLDEPTTFLDMGYQIRMMQYVRDLVDDRKILGIVATHEINYALQFSDSIAILQKGRIRSNGPPSSITAETIRDVYGVEVCIREEFGHLFLIPIRPV